MQPLIVKSKFEILSTVGAETTYMRVTNSELKITRPFARLFVILKYGRIT